MDTTGEDHPVQHPPLRDVEAALSALPAEARAVLWLYFIERAQIREIAESLRMTPEGTAFLIEKATADVVNSLSERGRVISAAGLATILLDLPPIDPPAGIEERILKRFERYFL